ncbi:MAG: sporulation integral membrane protein YtvI [Ruthenibacterium sp.]
MSVEKMRAFIIRFVFYCLLLGLAYCVLKYVLPMLTPFLLAFFFAFLLQPLITWCSKHTKASRKALAVLVLVAFYAVLITLVVLIGTRAVVTIRDGFSALPLFYAETLEPAIAQVQQNIESFFHSINPSAQLLLDGFGETITASLSALVTTISNSAITGVTGFATGLPSVFVNCLLTIISSFFFVTDYYKITSFLMRQLPKGARDLLFKIKSQGVDVLLRFARAYAILLSITFVELSIGFLLLGVRNALLVAFGVALVDILPVLGTGTILIPWGISMLILGDLPAGFGLLILYAIITVVRQTLEPRVVGKQIGLYPLITLVCMFVGAYLFGFVGMFGLPILVTIFVQLNRAGELHWFK